jgi:Flp pilus assembly pilin Flp
MDRVGLAARIQKAPSRRPTDEEGQGLVEYCLILLFVAVTLLFAVSEYGGQLIIRYEALAARIPQF